METKLSYICLPQKELKLDNQQEQIVLGSLMGDGSIKKISDNHFQYTEAHSSKQHEYLIWKNKFLNFNLAFFSRGETEINKCNLIFKKFYDIFYPSGKKKVSLEILNKLTPLALAVWYVDDGYYLYSTKSIGFSTCSFTKGENEQIINWFKRKGFLFKLSKNKKGYYFIRANVENSKKFLELISPITKNMPVSIDYKLGKDKIRLENARKNRNKASKKFRKLNPLKIKDINQHYYNKNRDKILQQKKEYWRKKYGN